MFKRILAALLAAGTVFAFSACKKDDNNTPVDVQTPVSGTETPDETEKKDNGIDYESDLSTERYDGYEYRIQTRINQTNTHFSEGPSEDIISDAIYRRNKAVEDRFGVKIVATEASGDFQTDALNSILAGDDAFDIIFAHSRAAFIYAIQGAAYNVHDIQSLHLDKPWWSKNLVDNCTVGGNLYVLDGDLSITGLEQAMALVFNKRIFDELGFDYPYEMVEEGDWTFDEFSYLAKKGGKELSGDGVMKPGEDQFGFTCIEWSAPINILYAGGQKIYDKNEEGYLDLTLYSNKTVEIFDSFFALLGNESCFFREQNNPNYNGPDIFKAGLAMMSDTSLGNLKQLRSMDDEFGVLPYPKFDDNDEYTTAINGWAPLGIIPITVKDVERTGAITEALCAYGSREVLPAFYEVSLKSKYARDDESEDMIDLIKDSLIYDIGYVGGGTFSSVGRDLALDTNHDFSSFYAAREAKALEDLASFNESYGGYGE